MFCQGSYFERAGQTEVCLKAVHNYVDRIVLIYDETYPQSKIDEWGKAYPKLDVYFEPWKDSMPEMRNAYLRRLNEGDWALASDPDEVFDEHFLRDIRVLIENAERNGVNQLLINSHDVEEREDSSFEERTSDFFKALLFKIGGDAGQVYYMGVGLSKNVHETLCGNWRPQALPKEYFYRHYKRWYEVWERAARNVFIGGGGNNVGEQNPAWKPLRKICDELGLVSWPQARDYFRKGNIDSRLKKWLWDNRFEGWDYQHEMMEFGRWYFEFLHPEEAEGWKPVMELKLGNPQEVMHYVEEQYLSILGRHADDSGKKFYTQEILEGRIKREDLPVILRNSAEWRQRFGSRR